MLQEHFNGGDRAGISFLDDLHERVCLRALFQVVAQCVPIFGQTLQAMVTFLRIYWNYFEDVTIPGELPVRCN